ALEGRNAQQDEHQSRRDEQARGKERQFSAAAGMNFLMLINNLARLGGKARQSGAWLRQLL
ncbi:MAG: hypothetical protein ACREDW_05845, partial [Aestuariivirgaceae bacterium]